MLKIEHLTKTYGEKKAVDDLTLHIAPGEIYGFIGHNGAGKAERNNLTANSRADIDGGIGAINIVFSEELIQKARF